MSSRLRLKRQRDAKLRHRIRVSLRDLVVVYEATISLLVILKK